ncbi:hypothetical protein L915_20928 [Phytophthora nicotianae]|uniref:Uncharacterized protein n=1 Tax=Phytophthora nicotianae TaxID=4792 RepID=W2HVU2_PHYNI|nr:hypothetical protein L915_20928 [Phytophthora nicotianae]ETL25317.1 hypothetical protein L916_20810 [Phytophthora nicotianae]ETM31815.1 hypothetical protein L914_20676 [Phytophthora nicotianae]
MAISTNGSETGPQVPRSSNRKTKRNEKHASSCTPSAKP